MKANAAPARWKSLAAFAIIYLVWGSTFLAIRIGVREVPPFLLASLRFFISGILLYAWALLRREPAPTREHWRSAFILGFPIFVVDYGLVFWAEQRIPSGITAVMMANIPIFMALSEAAILKTQKFTVRLALALAIGFVGVATLVVRSMDIGGEAIDTGGAIALLIAAIGWSVASALMRKLPLPSSKAMSSAIQMLAGGLLLAVVTVALGEFQRFQPSHVSAPAWFSLLYLIVPGSIAGFTAYVWLLQHHSPTKVGTHAYVNPLVAVVIGYFFADETLGFRTLAGAGFILISVVMITTIPRATRPSL